MSEKPQYWAPQARQGGMNALHYAAYCQDLAAVKRCIEQGFDVHQQDDGGWTPLVWCTDMAATGPLGTAEAIVGYLVQQGATLAYHDDDYSRLVEFARSPAGGVQLTV